MAESLVVVDLVPEPSLARGARPSGGRSSDVGIAIDVLRATSTLTVARANGAARILPFASPREAITFRDANPGVLACGERGGRIVPGFDLGNSPAEFAPERVAGRTLAFASTNGSRALLALAGCSTRWLGAYVSASDLVARLAGASRIRIVCAGKEGAFALEDASCAGWFVTQLVRTGARVGNDAAALCASLAPRDASEVRAVVEGCDHARTLRELGGEYARDVELCATLDAAGDARDF